MGGFGALLSHRVREPPRRRSLQKSARPGIENVACKDWAASELDSAAPNARPAALAALQGI